MTKNLKYKIALIIAVIALCAYFAYPPYDKKDEKGEIKEKGRINLGLDLKGGTHMVLEVDIKKALEDEINGHVERIQADLRDKQIPYDSVKRGDGQSILISGVPPEKETDLKDYLDRALPVYTYAPIQLEAGKTRSWKLAIKPAYIRESQEQTVNQSLEVMRRRVDAFGVSEPILQRAGTTSGDKISDQIVVELPGVDDLNRIRDVIIKPAQLELKLVHPEKGTLPNGAPYPSREDALKAFNGSIPPDYEILSYSEASASDHSPVTGYMVIKRMASLTGKHLKEAHPRLDELKNSHEVTFVLDSQGREIFGRVTEANVDKLLAIVLDNKVRSAPRINQKIGDGSAVITGHFSADSARDLATILRSGALPAQLKIIEERHVGPSLGRDSILHGLIGSLVGLGLVVTAMMVYYHLAGLNAILALALNLLILLGFMGWIHATLTLPGIAGIALTIGMAVDSNVLIFERIKEELWAGKTVRSAIDIGFNKAFRAIFDTHVTSLTSAFFLFEFGTGPVRGFAVSLSAGLIANLFTAVFVSRVIFDSLLSMRKVERLSI